MPIATPEVYAQMLDRAKDHGFAYPAINVTSSQTLNAALRGFADANSDGIIQVSTGGAEYLSGSVKEMVVGASALAEYARVVAAKYPVISPCTPTTAPRTSSTATCGRWCRSPPNASPAARTRCSSPTCGTAPRSRWTRTCRSPTDLLEQCAAARIVMELEIGVVGGEEDGVDRRDEREALQHSGRRAGDHRRRSVSVTGDGTCWPRRSGTSTASTSQVTSSSAPRSCRRSRRRSAPSTARTGRSTWCSTADPGQRWRRSARRSPTASSR